MTEQALTAHCMKCKEKRTVGDSSDGSGSAGVTKTKKGTPALTGWCTVCGTKCFRFLSKTNDADLIASYSTALVDKGKATGKGVSVEPTGSPAGGSAKKRVPPAPKDTPSPKKKNKPTGKEKKPVTKVKPKKSTPKKVKAKTASKKKAPAPTRGSVSKIQGKVDFPVKIFARYGPRGSDEKKSYRAMMKAADLVRYAKQNFASPTMAAVAVTGTKVNGWQFWKYKNAAGEDRPISELRVQSSILTREATTAKHPPKERDPNKLPPYSKDYVVTVPEEFSLPKRSTKAVKVVYAVNPSLFKRFKTFCAFVLVNGELALLPCNKEGKINKPKVIRLGEIDSWEEAIPIINQTMDKKKLTRAKVV